LSFSTSLSLVQDIKIATSLYVSFTYSYVLVKIKKRLSFQSVFEKKLVIAVMIS